MIQVHVANSITARKNIALLIEHDKFKDLFRLRSHANLYEKFFIRKYGYETSSIPKTNYNLWGNVTYLQVYNQDIHRFISNQATVDKERVPLQDTLLLVDFKPTVTNLNR